MDVKAPRLPVREEWAYSVATDDYCAAWFMQTADGSREYVHRFRLRAPDAVAAERLAACRLLLAKWKEQREPEMVAPERPYYMPREASLLIDGETGLVVSERRGSSVRTDAVVTARGFWRLVEAFDGWDARMAPADGGATTEEATMCDDTAAKQAAGQAMGGAISGGRSRRGDEVPGRATYKGALACASCGAAMYHGRGPHGDYIECSGEVSCVNAGRRYDPPVVYLDAYGARAL